MKKLVEGENGGQGSAVVAFAIRASRSMDIAPFPLPARPPSNMSNTRCGCGGCESATKASNGPGKREFRMMRPSTKWRIIWLLFIRWSRCQKQRSLEPAAQPLRRGTRGCVDITRGLCNPSINTLDEGDSNESTGDTSECGGDGMRGPRGRSGGVGGELIGESALSVRDIPSFKSVKSTLPLAVSPCLRVRRIFGRRN
jgi:hypothetical protein